MQIVGSVLFAAEELTESPIAIVVHKDTPVENLSLDELRSIFLADQQFWSNRTRITLLVRAPQWLLERVTVFVRQQSVDTNNFDVISHRIGTCKRDRPGDCDDEIQCHAGAEYDLGSTGHLSSKHLGDPVMTKLCFRHLVNAIEHERSLIRLRRPHQ